MAYTPQHARKRRSVALRVGIGLGIVAVAVAGYAVGHNTAPVTTHTVYVNIEPLPEHHAAPAAPSQHHGQQHAKTPTAQQRIAQHAFHLHHLHHLAVLAHIAHLAHLHHLGHLAHLATERLDE